MKAFEKNMATLAKELSDYAIEQDSFRGCIIFAKSRTNNKTCTLELLHYDERYKHGNKTLTFYNFTSPERLKDFKDKAMRVISRNELIEEATKYE